MASQTYQGLLVSQTVAGTLFNSYTTAKSVIDPGALKTFGAGQDGLGVIGKTFRTKVWGGLSNIVTTPGTVTFQQMIGAAVAWTSGAVQLNATAHTLLPFKLEVDWRVDSIGTGTAAKILGMGVLSGIHFTNTAGQVDAVNTSGAFPVPVAAPAVGGGFDSTIANILDFWAGFSISNAGNGIQIYGYTVEQLN